MIGSAFSLIFILCLIPIESKVSKRQTTFRTLRCMGRFDREKFNTVSKICEDCFQLYREPEVIQGCKNNCFDNDYFGKCVEALNRSDELEKLLEMVRYLNE